MITSPAISQTEPGTASAEDGLVILDGPAGIAITMTAGAAAETGHRLISAAEIAQHQMAAKPQSDDS